MTEPISELIPIRDDDNLTQNLNKHWETWDTDTSSDGLARALDDRDSSWREWDKDKLRSTVTEMLDQRLAEVLLAWIFNDSDLTGRLVAVWGGDAWQEPGDAGLIGIVDTRSDWDGWRLWDNTEQLTKLGELLTEWEPAAEEETETETAVAVEEDFDQPRWNEQWSCWEQYNYDAQAWWAVDSPSGTWYDPQRQEWVPQSGEAAVAEEVVEPTEEAAELTVGEDAEELTGAELTGGEDADGEEPLATEEEFEEFLARLADPSVDIGETELEESGLMFGEPDDESLVPEAG
jgi:hypothetical protein